MAYLHLSILEQKIEVKVAPHYLTSSMIYATVHCDVTNVCMALEWPYES